MKKTRHEKIQYLTRLSILVAIMLLFAFTPIGYIRLLAVEITLMILPVAIGAIWLGPAAGAFLGGVFGVTSFVQCFGLSAFGTFLLSLSPILTFITCMIPRILCGWLSGLLFEAVRKNDKTKVLSYFVASLSTALLNTLLFMLCIVLFFWKNALFIETMGAWGITTDSLWIFLIAFVGINGLVEAIVNCVIGGSAAKVLSRYMKHD